MVEGRAGEGNKISEGAVESEHAAREDSGEGRWTIEDATAHDVPTPVITASLYERLRSRGNGDFADRVLAALRNQFGGHAVKSAPAGSAGSGGAGGKGAGDTGGRSAGGGAKAKATAGRTGK